LFGVRGILGLRDTPKDDRPPRDRLMRQVHSRPTRVGKHHPGQ
jgi:hypothetical protein